MEKDVFLSHGASATTKERLCKVSDIYKMAVCKQCGTTAVFNKIERHYYCPICETSQIGALTIPYVYKYQSNLLASMGWKLAPIFTSPKSITKTIKHDISIEDVNSDNSDSSSDDSESYDNPSDGSSEESEVEYDEELDTPDTSPSDFNDYDYSYL